MTEEQIKKMEDDLKNDNAGADLSIQTEEVPTTTKTEQQIAAEQSTKKKKGKN